MDMMAMDFIQKKNSPSSGPTERSRSYAPHLVASTARRLGTSGCVAGYRKLEMKIRIKLVRE